MFQKTKLCPMNTPCYPDTTKHHHPSPLLRGRRTGRGDYGDQGMTDRTPQEGPWLAQLPGKGGGRVYYPADREKQSLSVEGSRWLCI